MTKERVDQLIYMAMNTCTIKDFGEALHTLQDYYSHTLQGYNPLRGHLGATIDPDIPANNLDLFIKCNQQPIMQ